MQQQQQRRRRWRRRALVPLLLAAAWVLLAWGAPARAAAAPSSLSGPSASASRPTRKETAEMARRARRRREESEAAVRRGTAALPPLPEALNVSILTWNMGEKSPPMSDVAMLAGLGLDSSDLTVLGVQEVENLKPRRHEGSRSREWRRLVLKTLGRTHALLSLTSLGGLQLAVLAKKSLVPHLSPLHICEVPCGVGNVLHNKGAQAALFRVGVDRSRQHGGKGGGGGGGAGTAFLFVNAHLAAHQHKVEERNGDVDRVMTELQSHLWFHLNAAAGHANGKPGGNGPNSPGRNGGGSSSSSRGRPLQPPLQRARDAFAPDELVGKVDRLFFFGDLNYRLELPREDVEIPLRRVKSGRVTQAEAVARMLEYDQLGIERAKGRIFKGLEEPHVGFLPTFKFNKGRDNYDTSPKRRAPAWTDRVLFKPCDGAVECTHYDSVPTCRHSDHRPVLARFRVALRPPTPAAAAEGEAMGGVEGGEEGGVGEGGEGAVDEAAAGPSPSRGNSSGSLLLEEETETEVDDDEDEEEETEGDELVDEESTGEGGESGYESDDDDSEY